MSDLLAATAASKAAAFVLGLIALVILSSPSSGYSTSGLWVIVLWYLTLGGIVGLLNVYENQPVFGITFYWWIRAPLAAGWMNLVVVLLAPAAVSDFAVLSRVLRFEDVPAWFVADGIAVGLVTGVVSYQTQKRLKSGRNGVRNS